MTSGIGSICFACKRFRAGTGACEAYPKGIPEGIMFGAFDHREPFAGDGGKLFELEPGREPALKAYETIKKAIRTVSD